MDKNKLAVNMFNNVALLYEEKYMDVSAYYESLDLLCEGLGDKKMSILELACGPGNITKYLIAKCHQYEILATDLAPAMIELAKVNCPTATFELLDCRKISTLKKTFDAIVSGFCFPYLNENEVKTFISAAGKSLTPGGFLYISTMHGKYDESGVKKSSTSGDEVYFYLYESSFIEKILIDNGFVISYSKIQADPTQEDGADLIIIAKCNE